MFMLLTFIIISYQLRIIIDSQMTFNVENLPIMKAIIESRGKQQTAFLCMFLGSCILCFSVIFPNQNKITSIESNLARGIANIVFNIILSSFLNVPLSFKDPRSFKLVILRSTFMVLYNYIFLIAHFYLPLPIIQSLNCGGPLFVLFIDYMVNGTVISKNQLIGSFIGMMGIIIAANGELIKGTFQSDYAFESEFQNYQSVQPLVMVLMCGVLLFGIFLFAIAIVITKKVKLNILELNTNIGIMFTISFGLLYLIQVSKPISFELFLMNILFNGFPHAISIFMMNSSFLLTKQIGRLSIIMFVSVFVSYLISIFRYHQKINYYCLFGDFLILLGVYKVIFND